MQGSEYKAEGGKVLEGCHDWIQSGAGGKSNWAMEDVNHEGWRVNVDEGNGKQGWLLLRQSLHDPLLVLNAESETKGGKPHKTLSIL